VTVLAANESGATSIEYALIGCLIALVLVGALTTIGTSINSTLATVSTNIR
jgi:pilus assembly protein Flp/PilA